MKKLLRTLRSIPLQAKPSVVADLVLPHIPLRSQYSWRGGDRKSAYFDLTAIKIARYIFGLVRFSLNICHIHACNINTKDHFPINSKLFRCSVLQTETSTTTGGTPTTFQGLIHGFPNTRFQILASEVQFFFWPKITKIGRFRVPKNGTLDAQIQKRTPLFVAKYPQK